MSADHWVVGSEYDHAIFERLCAALLALGYRLGSEWNGIGGSQEISHWEVSCPDGSLTVEAETYIGLSVSGPANLVAAVKQQFSKALPANNSLHAHRPSRAAR
jgi:hypothetical protein